MVNALLFHLQDLSGIAGRSSPRIRHRIDKMTVGAGRGSEKRYRARLACPRRSRRIPRAQAVYIAIVEGNIKEESGDVDAPIGRHPSTASVWRGQEWPRRPLRVGACSHAWGSLRFGIEPCSKQGVRTRYGAMAHTGILWREIRCTGRIRPSWALRGRRCTRIALLLNIRAPEKKWNSMRPPPPYFLRPSKKRGITARCGWECAGRPSIGRIKRRSMRTGLIFLFNRQTEPNSDSKIHKAAIYSMAAL